MPSGYDSYSRIFYPFQDDHEEVTLCWSEVAETNGWAVHPEMTPESIARPAQGAKPTRSPVKAMVLPYLPEGQLAALAGILKRHTTTPDLCWFGIWEGYGNLGIGRGKLDEPPRFSLEWRDYLLYRGQLDGWRGLADSGSNAVPELWWPDDRAWVLATDCDFSWAYVGGTTALIDELVASSVVEGLRTEPGHVAV